MSAQSIAKDLAAAASQGGQNPLSDFKALSDLTNELVQDLGTTRSFAVSLSPLYQPLAGFKNSLTQAILNKKPGWEVYLACYLAMRGNDDFVNNVHTPGWAVQPAIITYAPGAVPIATPFNVIQTPFVAKYADFINWVKATYQPIYPNAADTPSGLKDYVAVIYSVLNNVYGSQGVAVAQQGGLTMTPSGSNIATPPLGTPGGISSGKQANGLPVGVSVLTVQGFAGQKGASFPATDGNTYQWDGTQWQLVGGLGFPPFPWKILLLGPAGPVLLPFGRLKNG